jgi:polynucleotide 5'-kinase involved in rRNA processing
MLSREESIQSAADEEKLVVAVGPTDSGKSTWIHQVAQQIESAKMCLISGDLGQAIFGAPGLLSAGFFTGQQELSAITPEKMYFVGENNPPGRFLQTLDGLSSLTSFAGNNADRILLDTDGLIAGPAAREYKRLLLNAVKPAAIYFFGNDPTLEPLKNWCEARSNLDLQEVGIPDNIVQKTQSERTQNRNRMLKNWFSEPEILRITLQDSTIYSGATSLGRQISASEHHDLEKILQTDVLCAEKSHTWLNILLTTRADRENVSKLHQEYDEKKVNLIQFSTWHHRLIGDFAADGFSSGMGYVSNYKLDPPRLVVKGKFLREPGHTWMLGRGSYNPDEVM